MISLSARCASLQPAHAHGLRPKASHVSPARSLVRSAAGPGGMFDEAPTEPITTEQRQISEELMDSMKSKIETALEAERVDVKDVYGDHQHVSIEVVSAQFEDKTTVQRQRMVYKAIWQELQDTVHAVDEMKTKTPAEAAS
eukprot:jgi/Ulvmu1/5381/UM022_0176.1